ncbi:Uncharacterized protein BP5553_00580 [Venustampulla echinocandica]|uniref:Uncharacterized protein n=1 Tax=Venustampulla echinocandica TaxID=2656787 RepID=A0A370TYJ9_9HELO|nr:Uncharacterized protein BP5553_00580 [Venustampulla echinocandica]RDL40601.1 Uncharacterized protein BP5553_00580 [Venustampulla echinocandica]
MSSDLLAEFDSFYTAPQDARSNTAPALNDLAVLGGTNQQHGHTAPGGTQTQWQSQPANPSDDIWGGAAGFQSNLNNSKPNVAEEDIWGSFENATQVSTEPTQPRPPATTSYSVAVTTKPGQNGPRIVRRPTLDLFSSNITESQSMPSVPATKPESLPPQRPAAASKGSFGEILFDAADEISADQDDEDEFGDFETFTAESAPEPPPPASQSLETLFGATTLAPKIPNNSKALSPAPLTLSAGTLPYPQAPKSPSFQERNPFGQQLALAMNQVEAAKKADKPQSASPVTAWPSFEVPKPAPYQDSPAPNDQPGDEWGDFADLPESPPGTATKAASGILADAWAWDAADGVASEPASIPPPTNVPPPSVLLTLFPPLFDLPKDTLLKGVVNQPFPMKNRILSDPSTISFLRAYILIATVAARIIAGRKLRWKRDTILSQSMKIGPSAAGGKGGMKLTGVDKAEVTREERESAEVVRVWKEQLGRLRSAVAVANSSISDTSQHLTIPEISETIHVKTQEGGLTAPKPCVICGIKREERVSKVDVQVEDSFGEWWIEYWGHRACKNFWQEHESKLKHR